MMRIITMDTVHHLSGFKQNNYNFLTVFPSLYIIKMLKYQPFLYSILHLRAKEQSEIETTLTGKTNKTLQDISMIVFRCMCFSLVL